TLGEIDDTFSIVQQVVYLLLIGCILYWDLLGQNRALQIPPRLQKIWELRPLVLHFILGSLLRIYSLFFLKGSSIFSSIVFVLFLMALMIANELKIVKESQLNIKMGLFVVCVFSFLSTLVPVLFGFVGIFPFLVTLLLSSGVMGGIFWLLQRRRF